MEKIFTEEISEKISKLPVPQLAFEVAMLQYTVFSLHALK